MQLTRTQIESFNRDRFLCLSGFFDAQKTAEVVRWTEEVAGMPELPGRHMVYYEDSFPNPRFNYLRLVPVRKLVDVANPVR